MIRNQVAQLLRNARRDRSAIKIERDADRTYTFSHEAYSYKIVIQRRQNVYVYLRKNYADGTYDIEILKSRCVSREARLLQRNRMSEIIGKWPGTDAEFDETMREIEKEREMEVKERKAIERQMHNYSTKAYIAKQKLLSQIEDPLEKQKAALRLNEYHYALLHECDCKVRIGVPIIPDVRAVAD